MRGWGEERGEGREVHTDLDVDVVEFFFERREFFVHDWRFFFFVLMPFCCGRVCDVKLSHCGAVQGKQRKEKKRKSVPVSE